MKAVVMIVMYQETTAGREVQVEIVTVIPTAMIRIIIAVAAKIMKISLKA